MRILLADDHSIGRRGIRGLLAEAGLTVAAEAEDGLTAVRLCASIVIIAAIIGESLMGLDGLGRLFSQSFQLFDTPRAGGASMLIVVLSVAAYSVSSALERRIRRSWSL